MSVIELRCRENGAQAKIAVNRGMNCFSWLVPCGGRDEELLWAEDGFAGGAGRPSGSGVPILFPFPGRIAGAAFEWSDRPWRLPEGDGQGNAIHGFVLDRPWRVEARGESHVVAVFRASEMLADWESVWPSDFEIACRFELARHRLAMTLVAHNPSDVVLPCGLGLHPYFRVDAKHEESELELPVTEEYELKGLIPTGNHWPLKDAGRDGVRWRLAGRTWDNVYGGMVFSEGKAVASAFDGARRIRIECRWDAHFPYGVVYTPEHREAVCIEPYSTLPNPFELESRGIDASWWHLAPGESREMRVEFHADSQ